MKQLITRVDDRIVEGLKARARAEGRSVNSLVNELLADAVRGMDRRRDLSARLRAAGMAVDVRPTVIAAPRDEVIAMTRGAGMAVMEELLADRGRR